MSTYWTEDIVITERKTYLKCFFKGKYYADRLDDLSLTHSEYFQMSIYESEAIIDEIKKPPLEHFAEAAFAKSFADSLSQPISCFDKSSNTYFKLKINEPKIADVKLSDVVKEGTERYGTITGILYGHISEYVKESVKIAYERQVDPTSWTNTGLTGQGDWIRTARHELSIVNGVRNRRDYYTRKDGSSMWGTWYPLGRVNSFRSGFGSVMGFILSLFILGFLISLSWLGLIILGFLFFTFLFFRIFKTGFGTSLYHLFFFFYLIVLAISIFNTGEVKHSYVSKTPMHVRSPDYSIVEPVKPYRKTPTNTNATIADTGGHDEWIIHHKSWTDLAGNQYEGDVKVLRSDFNKAEIMHHDIKNAVSLSEVYSRMTSNDASHLDHVYTLFDSLQNVHHLDSIAFAGMLVSYVQSIPYVSVKDGDCIEDKDFSYSLVQGPTTDQCIGNVPYGVQSPVEFMSNFEGDCDTRTLFLFTLLNHYKYKVAMLGSEAFRHSLLGIDLPVPGSSKLLGNHRYVLWETTSTGFQAGNLPDQINHMDYWNFNLINQP